MKNLLICFTLFFLATNPLAAQEQDSAQSPEPVEVQEPKQTPDVVDDNDTAKAPVPVETPAALNPKDQALMQSVWDGDLAKVELLVKKGANVNAVEPKKKRTSLMLATTKKNLEIVRYLTEKGADVNARDSDGQTALMYACRQHFNAKPENAIALFLLNNGAEVNLQSTKKGFTALMLAAGAGNVELVQQLLAKGADPAIRDNFGVTAAAAAQKTGHSNVVDMLSEPPTPDAAE